MIPKLETTQLYADWIGRGVIFAKKSAGWPSDLVEGLSTEYRIVVQDDNYSLLRFWPMVGGDRWNVSLDVDSVSAEEMIKKLTSMLT